jgi:hypothetical protein
MGVSRSEVLRRGLDEVAQRDSEQARADLVRRGLLKPAEKTYTPIPESERRPIMTLEQLLKDLDEFRADREIPR